jgi:hypothetical protein
MKTDEQFESSRRLEEYRIRCEEREVKRIALDEFQELNTINRINEIYLRTPKPQKKFNYYVLGQDDE